MNYFLSFFEQKKELEVFCPKIVIKIIDNYHLLSRNNFYLLFITIKCHTDHESDDAQSQIYRHWHFIRKITVNETEFRVAHDDASKQA